MTVEISADFSLHKFISSRFIFCAENKQANI